MYALPIDSKNKHTTVDITIIRANNAINPIGDRSSSVNNHLYSSFILFPFIKFIHSRDDGGLSIYKASLPFICRLLGCSPYILSLTGY